MTVALISHPSAAVHDMGAGHPERPDRFRVVQQVLSDPVFADLNRIEAPAATPEMLKRVHRADYVDRLLDIVVPQGRMLRIDADTVMNAGTQPAALHASGGAALATDEVMSGRADRAFVAMRPPGHHAERETAMGFCFFNSAAVAARHAQAMHGAERVAIVDFDVHHGNGTQDIFWADETVLYCSTHQMPLFPGTGSISERGDRDTIVNAPLRPGDDGAVFRQACETVVLPRLAAFAPDLLIISAGFDAHYRDPLAELRLVEDDFAWITAKLCDVADTCCGGRVVSVLEGGYDLEGLALSTAAHVSALMGRST